MIKKLEKLCLQKQFNRSEAEEIIRTIDVNQVFKSSDFDLDTTLLNRAVDGANYEMIELLLHHGANPNLVHNGENVLWDLQYSSDDVEEDKIRLSIVKLFLENGANPRLKIDGYELIEWAISNWGKDEDLQSDYRFKYINLLEEYDFNAKPHNNTLK